MTKQMITLDGNEAAARVAHKVNEVIAIYPITPSSPMGEFADQWSAEGKTNIWGSVPMVVEMQAEGGAAGAVHGALQAGALTTTFTASQGLLLMIPNMYKIAGELTSTVFHIAARSLAAQALSIFGDHSDVMAARNTGWALLASNSVQEVHDFALIASAATLETRIPFLHFFDGFRTSHELNKIELIEEEVMRAMINDELVRAHRDRGLTPDHPVLRGTAQNPDVYFQARESVNPFYLVAPEIVQQAMDKFAALTGRQYKLFEYAGAPDAERVIVLMGSGAATAQETAEYLAAQGEKVGVVKVRLYRPFAMSAFLQALPPTVKAIGVLDRTKEPGSTGEPLYLDVVSAVAEAMATGEAPFATFPRIIGGRYGLSSKEFTPGMIKAVFDELQQPKPRNGFTVGINDDVTHTSLDWDKTFDIEPDDVVRAVFYGLGSDGTVGANKNSIKIIGEDTENYAQGYFVYDSKKAGSVTTSHLRFGPRPINATYLVHSASFVACHQFSFLERYDVLRLAKRGATFLLNSPYGPDEVWDKLPRSMQETIIEKKLRFFVVDGFSVAKETGMGNRINTIMQTCFFAISDVLPTDEAIGAIKYAIKKTYSKRGEAVVNANFNAVDTALAHMYQVKVPAEATSEFERPPIVPEFAPEFIQSVTARIIEGLGDDLPVSAMPIDGTYPTGTTKWEKRNITTEIPVWDPDICIQCGKCSMVCPHGVIRMKVYDPKYLADAPSTFKSTPARYKEFKDDLFTLQVAPEDCTGCTLCVEVCPVKNKQQPKFKAINMAPQIPLREPERENWEFFLGLPQVDRTSIPLSQVKYSQLLEPLFEFSGACAGCGETPYLKLMTQLFGDRAVVANATGCSSIYGANLPTTPWTKNSDGRGPSWSNSLFEDNAEFGFGMRVALDQRIEAATFALRKHREVVGVDLADSILFAEQIDEEQINLQRARVVNLQERLAALLGEIAEGDVKAELENLLNMVEVFVKKSVWIIGGDGWAYDIGYGGLDHVLASGRNVNVLVLDTEVYSNTGGQMSKATPRAAVAKFAAAGKPMPKKDLGMLAMSYGNIYVARVAMGANDAQTIRAFIEAEAYDGPSLILAYSHCVAHGYDLKYGLDQQKAAVDSAHWPLFRFNPDMSVEGKNPFSLDSRAPKISLDKYIYREGRYQMLTQSHPERAAKLLELAQGDVEARWEKYSQLAKDTSGDGKS
ncbi:MAG: pyruvate:ferredoxin (flavodoxin) oxidoreductase [Chloroflexi bacterium]|nr:pyruvate:ferredoxin (flavodoxin) oxidoreductase [Chloroflexota bacterium]MBK6711037.1 pyruvate:ferredoxin (flavodoxin) oxidoreductase [Chloroflexota bacterium]MBK7177970.1 pyruvate:ferredoxin (flavodoxin) oxidoreductase [Chloroflexota bacterium]MBK8930929.1 pyruvate:ferredoxin (flavodoxin) oxidoreductase [Chloroflexota bacterium]MBP6803642.1 pyruvate:ferredoxin (flavodoxin) oxidoreductase [Chloroflexota bacterium]